MKNNSAALVIGLCSHGLSITRALASKGIDVFTVEKDMSLPGAQTNSCIEILQINDYENDTLLKFLDSNAERFNTYQSVVLFPSNDKHVKFIAENINNINSIYKVSWSKCSDIIYKLLEKKNIESVALEKNLNYPKSKVFEKNDIPLNENLYFVFPVIVKPNAPLSSFKTEIAQNLIELKEILEKYQNEAPLLIQEYIEGSDTSIHFCALAYEDGVELSHLCGRKIKSYPEARGQTTIAETIIDEEVYQFTVKFFEGLNITGPVSLEIKKDPTGKIWIIEPTIGRTDFWSELCIRAGFNLPYIEYCIATNQKFTINKSHKQIMWYDTEKSPKSYFEDVIKYKSFKPNGKHPVFSYFRLNDIKPFLYAVKRLIARVF